jgi:hypothetical protein
MRRTSRSSPALLRTVAKAAGAGHPRTQAAGPPFTRSPCSAEELGFPIPSPAILEKIGLRFRRAVDEFAAANDIPVIRFAKGERKLAVMRPHLDRLARAGGCGGGRDRGGPRVPARVHRHLSFRARWWR